VSVIVQVVSAYRQARTKMVLIHHHFEQLGWTESQIASVLDHLDRAGARRAGHAQAAMILVISRWCRGVRPGGSAWRARRPRRRWRHWLV
jgi:hypothetical protein